MVEVVVDGLDEGIIDGTIDVASDDVALKRKSWFFYYKQNHNTEIYPVDLALFDGTASSKLFQNKYEKRLFIFTNLNR